MKRKILLLLLLSFFLLYGANSFAQAKVKKVVFQGFWWDYWNSNFPNKWANYLTELAPRLKAAGFDAIWIPPVYKNSSTNDVGYGPFDMYDLGDKYQKGGDSVKNTTRIGTKDELLRMIAVMHANGIEVIQDIVLNHNNGAGTRIGLGGRDTEPTYSLASNSGFKNFRFTSYATPLLNDSTDDYYSRNGRWPKNYTNYHPNPGDNCISGDICSPLFGPDISYKPTSIGQSTNIPTSGDVTINGVTRPYINPVQPSNYMRNSGRDWAMWFKKQTGYDGMRWDAVKHFPIDVQEDYIYNTKYGVPDFAKGGQDMFCVGEWIGGASDLDAYVNNIKTGLAPGNVANEKHTGTFDFSYRGYGPNGGIYSMMKSFGGYNMQNLPGEQQGERTFTYPDGHVVHRTVPFVNSHDTYRPRLDSVGNFLSPLGVDTGWNNGSELGGNGGHLDPREPRLAAAYAAVCAVDGNPNVFIEDLFDIGTTGKRYAHLPTDTTTLPVRKDIINIVQAHQKLGFKDGDYRVPTALTGSDAPFYQKGGSGDHLVIERAGKAVIGITDFFSTTSDNSQDQEVYVTVSSSLIGKQLYDYTGAHGITPTQVFNDSRVLIRTAPVGHTITGVYGHGYSIWAPAPPGVIVTSVNDLFNYIATYDQPRSRETTQEWEMADDLGDSHCKSLGQGGRLPDSSTRQRVAGKIFVNGSDTIKVKVFPEVDGKSITVSLWDLNGNRLAENAAVASASSPVTLNYKPVAVGWVIVKVRNTNNNYAGQKCWVNVTYTAPATVDTRNSANAPETRASVWTGNKKTTDVFDCGNWEEGRIPDINTKTVIPSFSETFPVMTSDFAVGDLVIENGASLTVDSFTLTLGGSLFNNGMLNASMATVEMKGSAPQVISVNGFTGSIVKNFIINNAQGVTLASKVIVTNVLTPTNGTLAAGGNLVLRSTATQTARIAKGAAAGGYITGDATVERYISSRDAYRLITAPFTTSQTIQAAWQEGATSASANPTPGFGTHITAGTAANGFDVTTLAGDTSMYVLNNGNSVFQPVAATNVSLANNAGYLLRVRGDRSIDINNANAAATSTVLRSSGALKTGDQSPVAVAAQGFTVVGNPYVSPVDFSKVSLSNVPDRLYVMDPQRAGKGAFVLLEGPDYQPMNAAGTYVDSTTLLQSSQAFIVEGSGTAGTLTFTENSKVSNDRIGFRTQSNNDQRLQINLWSQAATPVLLDGAMARFDNSYLAAVSSEDAGKLANPEENLGIYRAAAKLMTVERRPLVTNMDTVFLWMYKMKQTNYQFEMKPANIPDSITAFLEDRFLNVSQPIDINITSYYPFNITTDPLSASQERFRIIFKVNSTLSSNYTRVKAYQQEKGIAVEWNIAAESNIRYYDVEKSANGERFNKVASILPKANNNNAASYKWLDVQPLTGNNFYRIKQVTQTGAVKYSQVVNVKLGSGKGEILVYPNPVENHLVTVQLINQAKGQYNIDLYNATGQKVFAARWQHDGGSATQSLKLNSHLATGNYQLIISNGNSRQTNKVIIR